MTWALVRTEPHRKRIQPFDWWCIGILSGLLAIWQGGMRLAKAGDERLWIED